MSITTLYAELVVVGTGALLFIVLSSYAFFGDLSFVTKFPTSALGATIVLIPILCVIYLLGIIIANVSHLLFRGFENDLRRKALGKEDPKKEDLKKENLVKNDPECDEYGKVRNELYTSPNTQNFVHDFEFRRSKVRICRGWCLNSLLIMVALLACFGNGRISLPVTVYWCVTLGLLAAGALVSWYTATTTELDWMSSFAKQRSKPQSTKQSLPPFIDA